MYSPVAQLVEQVAVNHPVAGSSPARGVFFLKKVPEPDSNPIKRASPFLSVAQEEAR